MSRYQEEDEGRLIKAAMGDDALPTPEAERRVLRLILAEQQVASKAADFPDIVLGILGGMLVVIAVLLGLRQYGLGLWAITSVPLAPATWMVCLNLAAVPVAAIAVIVRRRVCQHV